jgi:hypothetical protein
LIVFAPHDFGKLASSEARVVLNAAQRLSDKRLRERGDRVAVLYSAAAQRSVSDLAEIAIESAEAAVEAAAQDA